MKTPGDNKVEVAFEAEDLVDRPKALELIRELAQVGVEARIDGEYDAVGVLPAAAIVALVALVAPTAAGLAVVAAFIYRVFRCAVVLDLTRERPRITKSRELPLGSLLIVSPDGRAELHEGVPGSVLGDIIKDCIRNAHVSSHA